MLKINGKDEGEFIGKTVAQLLAAKGLKPERIAVELNGEILQFHTYIILLCNLYVFGQPNNAKNIL